LATLHDAVVEKYVQVLFLGLDVRSG
jgi:hypothetical protein